MGKVTDVVRRKLKWSNLSAFMRARIAQSAAIIPVAGYLLLWSESASTYLSLQTEFERNQWLSFETKLYLIYYGSFFLLISYAVFFIRCPKNIKKHLRPEEYALESQDALTKLLAANHCDRARSFVDLDDPTAKFNEQARYHLKHSNIGAENIGIYMNQQESHNNDSVAFAAHVIYLND